MKKLTFKEFMTQSIYSERRGVYEVKQPNEIVALVKELSRIIRTLQIKDGLNFIGCSEDYVQEKIDLLMIELKWLKKRVKEVDNLT